MAGAGLQPVPINSEVFIQTNLAETMNIELMLRDIEPRLHDIEPILRDIEPRLHDIETMLHDIETMLRDCKVDCVNRIYYHHQPIASIRKSFKGLPAL